MPAPSDVQQLIDKFRRNRDSYESAQYNEAQTRIQFINPLFTALGWDVENRSGYAEAYKDVVHEDSLKIGGATKAPDYCFRIGGTRKFFVEAKKPSIRIKDDADAAYQLRRYAWSAKLPLSVLCNFSSLALYDCRNKPSSEDRASTGRVHYWTLDDFDDKWDEIESILRKESVLQGSFDKYATSHAKRGTAEVDDAFLLEIEQWRLDLARNIALRPGTQYRIKKPWPRSPTTQLRGPANHRPDRFPKNLRRPRPRALRTPPGPAHWTKHVRQAQRPIRRGR
jgi:hypothetical protein